MIVASQAIRRIVSGDKSCPVSMDAPAPHRDWRSCRSTVTYTAGLVASGAAPPAAAACSGRPPADLDQRVTAALVGGAQVRTRRGGFRCRQRPEYRLQHFFAFGVQAQPVHSHPVVIDWLGEADAVFELVVAALELSLLPVGRDELVPKRADLPGPVVGGDLDEPRPHRLNRLIA